MPPPTILDPSSIDTSRLLYTREQIYQFLPQRYEFEQLHGIIRVDQDAKVAAGIRSVKADEWWCRGHMPGAPLFPGVLMIECAAQLAAFIQHLLYPMKGEFMAFGGIDGAKFRGSVAPPAELIVLVKEVEARSRRYVCDVQTFCNDLMVFEARITGVPWIKEG
jgi:3-hydroxyacyl-[acyl-carrier-protein] dehydratase